MSSRAVVLSGKPRVRRSPRSVSNEVDDAVFLASNYGLVPDEWQEDVLESWLGRRSDGRWSAATCGLAVPRQNGKNAVIEVRELFGMVALGEKFLHTAHEVKTARKAFLRISSFFENEREYPELAALKKEIRKTNGQEAVILTNGGSVEFIARSKGSGRGFTVDVLVCDEAQELTNEELEALLPTISAAPTGHPQKIFTGTPPKPDRVQGEAFRAVRTAGERDLDARLAWTDYGAPDGPMPDADDKELWFAYNPSLGIRLHIEEVEDERLLLGAEGFAVERLGWWGDTTGGPPVFPNWPNLAVEDDQRPSFPAFAVETTLDQSWTAIGIAGHRDDERFQVEVADYRPDSTWAVDRVLELREKWSPGAAVVIDPRSPAGALIADLEEAGVRIVKPSAQDVSHACASFYNLVTDGLLAHRDETALNDALRLAKQRALSDAWAWDRKAGNVAALYAVTLAAWAARFPVDVLETIW